MSLATCGARLSVVVCGTPALGRARTPVEGGWPIGHRPQPRAGGPRNVPRDLTGCVTRIFHKPSMMACYTVVEYTRGDGDNPVVRRRSAVPLGPAKQEEISMTSPMRSLRPALRFRAFLAITVSIFITATVAVESRGQEKPDAPKVKKTDDKVPPKAKSGSGAKVDKKKGASNEQKRATRRKLQSGSDAPKGAKRKISPTGASPSRKLTAARKKKGAAAFEMNPNAKWVCDKTEVTLPPIWRRDEGVTFDFKIRNAGTADLKIRAKGG